MKSSKRKICQVLALVVSGMGASVAMAAGPLIQGGGSSLVAPTIGASANPNVTPPVTASGELGLFGSSNASFTYFSVGSGAGQNAFLNNQPTYLGAGVTGTVNFANSDAALTTAQVASYNASTIGANSGPLIQIPYIVTAITVPVVNAPAVTSSVTPQTTPGQAHSIALNDDDLCGIFSGKLTNWNQVTNPEGGFYSTNAPIKVIYRSDSSGTTELLTRHLAAVCTTGNTATGVKFVDSLTFANTTAFPSGVPGNFIGASGSGPIVNGVVTGVRGSLASLSSAGVAAVAYLSPDYTNTFLASQSSVVTSSGALQLPVASLYNSTNGAYYAPTYANATTALGTIAAPSNPADPNAWVPVSGPNYAALANPKAGYPVSGTSQIILSQCYANPTVASNVQSFLNNHYTNASYASVVHGNGFDTVPSSFRTAISANFLSNSSGNGLDIGDAGNCSLYTGR
ncbi:TPA: substrate-binding domain-containing protein [Burkholderia aenigmatica]|uniref:substrate-binding domain-containing protein n=1 Tax=Burkholderia sp. AU45251 TaxID=3059204 RepID=UPI0026551895|nr:substrate-binding domain-containing protein [Burkholderia sp. AU45251]HDR9481001.1 substrate-binding domain-containing protein [Burkholderia aenigmatica]MDN7514384.1 substrate-binding domain-containing protein [Burkholderia sp. AU45251]HDR9517477.1 substrate-binding domain-containing protein [Burkholderia aenigmatica]HDR9594344.1 substrate-binding domain-containing protein [Burkholderia aenigmatica]HDR9603203.1 substrate-binding domain-containing protein [Burkholderia aenigmatica]